MFKAGNHEFVCKRDTDFELPSKLIVTQTLEEAQVAAVNAGDEEKAFTRETSDSASMAKEISCSDKTAQGLYCWLSVVSFVGVLSSLAKGGISYELFSPISVLGEKINTFKREREQKEREIKLQLHLAQQQKRLDIKQHLIQVCADIEQSSAQLYNDMRLASRETQRDMYDASNQKLQTLILASTVMFVSLSTVMVQGSITPGTPKAVISCIAFSGGLSFFCLLVSIVLSVELLHKTSHSMMNEAEYQQYKIENFIKTNNGFNFHDLRDASTDDSRDPRVQAKRREEERKKQSEKLMEERRKNRPYFDSGNSDSDIFSTAALGDVAASWSMHENVVREAIQEIVSSRDVVGSADNKRFLSFGKTWIKVDYQAYWADFFFYLGTWSFLLTMGMFLYQHFDDKFSNEVCLTWCVLSLVTMAVYVAYKRFKSPCFKSRGHSRICSWKPWKNVFSFFCSWKSHHKCLMKELIKEKDDVGIQEVMMKDCQESFRRFQHFKDYLIDSKRKLEDDPLNSSVFVGCFGFQPSRGNRDPMSPIEHRKMLEHLLHHVDLVEEFYFITHEDEENNDEENGNDDTIRVKWFDKCN